MSVFQCNLSLLAFFCIIAAVSGLKCDSEFLGIQKSCPGPFDNDDEEFCCLQSDGSYSCCSAAESLSQAGLGVVITVIVALIIGSAIACCLCCLCCPCCLLYKRRNRGAVYGRIQTTVVTVPQAVPTQPAGFAQNQTNVQYPVQPLGQPMASLPPQAYSYPAYTPMPQPVEQAQPPPYSVATAAEAYPKQAPYNPAY